MHMLNTSDVRSVGILANHGVSGLIDYYLSQVATAMRPEHRAEELARKKLDTLMAKLVRPGLVDFHDVRDGYGELEALAEKTEIVWKLVRAARTMYLINPQNQVVPISHRSVWTLDLLRTYPTLDQVAASDFVTVDTLRSSLATARKKLGLHSTTQLMAWMYDNEYF